MKNILPIFLLLLVLQTSKAQTKAVTDNGKEVVLYNDGTWKYASDTAAATGSLDSIRMNPGHFSKGKSATFLVKSSVFDVGIYIDPAKWKFSGRKNGDKNPEFEFTMKTDDAYMIVITEKADVGLESMREIALINAKDAAPDARELSAEYRMVNGKKILCLTMIATIKGLKAQYLGYYYSCPSGTIQLLSYTTQENYPAVQKELENLLNGFVVLGK